MIAGITRARFPKPQMDAVVQDIQQNIVPLHEQTIKNQPGFRGAVFVVDKDKGEVVGITLWDNEQQLRAVEGELDRDGPGGSNPKLRDPQNAPNNYSKQRAGAIKGRQGSMELSDLCEVAFEVRP
jgi:hypothetical protein